MLTQLGYFFSGFLAPVPLLLIAVMVGVGMASWALANGRLSIGLPKSIARREWDAARRRRVEGSL
ncbi:MAG: hypothetical protein LBS27_10755 [Bifidobacteriaceae bacterium]|jgi:hypothetical protein|nr:hypothetical protein [Bifidobacteriaceae bacterium]